MAKCPSCNEYTRFSVEKDHHTELLFLVCSGCDAIINAIHNINTEAYAEWTNEIDENNRNLRIELDSIKNDMYHLEQELISKCNFIIELLEMS